MSNHDESKLPKWAQCELTQLRDELSRLKQAHSVLFDYDSWFTLGVNMKKPHRLFTCSAEGTHPVCSIGAGDIMLIGRKVEAQFHNSSPTNTTPTPADP